MAYADFDYYQNVYLGKTIPTTADFETPAERAADRIDNLTLGLDGAGVDERVKKANCAAAEAYYAYAKANGPDGAPISHESVGRYSVTYAVSATSGGNSVMALNKRMDAAILPYLASTGLLYRGAL